MEKNKEEESEDNFSFEQQTFVPMMKPRKSAGVSTTTFRMLRFGSVLQTGTDVSRINYMSTLTFEDIAKGFTDSRLRSFSMLSKNLANLEFDTTTYENNKTNRIATERYPLHVTSLLNEDQLWGCFYNFPDIYDDAYSPTVRIRSMEDITESEEGILTRDMVTPGLGYLKRTPILGDYVYIKLDLSSRHLVNIDVLQYYKYIVYLDLTSNFLTNLKILSHLLYLQYLCVNYNKLKTVLDYETPQWFLTEVHYKYNSVMVIRDLIAFWSITVLDLSHNNIKQISGLQNLRYLRHLDLSFNHIQRLENLNHLRLLWLDLSYNNISSFEFRNDAGLFTLLHLEYLNLNENSLTSMKLFSGCSRLRELYAKNNRFGLLMELAVYMRKLRRLVVLDLRSNPVCTVPGYMDVVINTFPMLLHLDAKELDPIQQRTSKMDMSPDVMVFATRRLLRLLYIQQLSRSRVSPYVPPADTTDVPLVVIVGYEAVGKGNLARRLANECSANVELALQHTTAIHHYANHYKVITRRVFDDMLLAGDFLTYSEMDGESYGLSREEAFVKDGKVKIVTMDLLGALMLKLRGYRPYLILANCLDKRALALRQHERKEARNLANEKRLSMDPTKELSTLQVLLSGRIIIKGILNEILQFLSDERKQRSDFTFESECSLMLESEDRQKRKLKRIDRIAMSISSSSSLDDKDNLNKGSGIDSGLYSLYKDIPGVDEYVSDVCGLVSYQDRQQAKKMLTTNDARPILNKPEQAPGRKSIDFSKSFTWKGLSTAPGSRKSSKSVTFISPENTEFIEQEADPSGMMVDPQTDKEMENLLMKSISAKVAWPQSDGVKLEDSDLWLAFLIENGLLSNSNTNETCNAVRRETKIDDPDFIVNQLDHYKQVRKELKGYFRLLDAWLRFCRLPTENFTTNIRDDYEEIHRKSPGIFYDTLTMDNLNTAVKKMKKFLENIVKSQKNLKPMLDIDFANMKHCGIIRQKLDTICKQIAPQRLFY